MKRNRGSDTRSDRPTNSRAAYGFRRVTAELNLRLRKPGHGQVNHKRIYRIMKLQGILLDRFTGTTSSTLTTVAVNYVSQDAYLQKEILLIRSDFTGAIHPCKVYAKGDTMPLRSLRKCVTTLLVFFLSVTLVAAHSIPTNAHRGVALRQSLPRKTAMLNTSDIKPSMTWTVTPITPFNFTDNVTIDGYARINVNLAVTDPTLFGILINSKYSPFAHLDFKTFVNWIYDHFNTASVAQYPWLPGLYSPLLGDAKNFNALMQSRPVLNSGSQSIPLGVNSLTALTPDISTNSLNTSFTVPIFHCKPAVDGNAMKTSTFRKLFTVEHLSIQLVYATAFIILAYVASYLSYRLTLNGNVKNSVAASMMASFVENLLAGAAFTAYMAPTNPIAWFFVVTGAFAGAYRVQKTNVYKDYVAQNSALLQQLPEIEAANAASFIVNIPNPSDETFCTGSTFSTNSLCQEEAIDWSWANNGWPEDSSGDSPAGSCGPFLPGPPATSLIDEESREFREPGPSRQYPGNNVTNPYKAPGPTPTTGPPPPYYPYLNQRLLVHQ